MGTVSAEVGRSASRTRHITADDILRFTELTGDRNPLHDDTDRRSGRDSNPRALQPLAFKASAFVHSATAPDARG